MKAVNLIPAEARRGAGGAAGKSGGAVYVLLGALALLVVALAATTMQSRTIDDRKAELAGLRQQVTAEQARAAELQAFAAFRTLREARVQTVTSLAQSRFDWGVALHEISRVVPKDVWLTQLNATAAPGVASGGSTGASSLRAALAVPAIELTGCTTSQPGVARAMAAFRRIDGVQRVSLASSEKSNAVAGGGGGGVDDCRQGRTKFPQFAMVVFFDAPVGTPSAAGAAGTTPAALTGPTGPTGAAGTTTGALQNGQATKDAALTQEEGK